MNNSLVLLSICLVSAAGTLGGLVIYDYLYDNAMPRTLSVQSSDGTDVLSINYHSDMSTFDVTMNESYVKRTSGNRDQVVFVLGKETEALNGGE